VPAPPLDNVGGACGLAQQLRVRLDGKAVLRPPFGKKAAEGGETPNLAARQHLEAQAQQLAVAVSALATEAATMTVAAVAAALQPLAVECGALCSAVLRTLQLKSHHTADAAALNPPPHGAPVVPLPAAPAQERARRHASVSAYGRGRS
jgi:hypothetical protein